ncbi:SprT family zinc-dependent metalloprotease [Sporomusa sp.]|uniref:M48 family metallopeptidase n=1 Tax=Sporomusa sp. TaxID=2078658 RepID=UPI002C960CCD|nr:SprT family zinc-dependent metalloprotease [Sporomusa sp.]HWR43756.1 SprT family zinc-dependent metalloprotease [Sporomusa sp.]
MPTINFNEQNIHYTLRLDKRRKNIQLRVLPTATVEIIAPGKLTSAEIEHIFTAKSRWLTGRLNKLSSLAANPVNQQLVSGAQLLYKGEPHTLTVLSGNSKPEVVLKPAEVIVKLPINNTEAAPVFMTEQIVKAWLIDQAGKLFLDKTKDWAAVIGVRPVRITIKDQKTRWGSCSSLGNINYNWRIIMAPPRVADYLIIHELCHMLVPNHSVKFWEQVSRFSPDYQECRKWLTDNGKLLSRIL